jgi:predicted nucleic acid-binding protein
MRLDEGSRGPIYVDTNVLYMYLRADIVYTPIIKAFLERVVCGELEAYVCILTLDELFYRLLLAKVKEATGRNPLDVLREDLPGAIAAHSGPIEAAMRKLMALPHVHLTAVEASAFVSMLENIRAYSLLPRDALHVAVMEHLGLTAIASDDTDFDRVGGVERHWVFNPPTPVSDVGSQPSRWRGRGTS